MNKPRCVSKILFVHCVCMILLVALMLLVVILLLLSLFVLLPSVWTFCYPIYLEVIYMGGCYESSRSSCRSYSEPVRDDFTTLGRRFFSATKSQSLSDLIGAWQAV